MCRSLPLLTLLLTFGTLSANAQVLDRLEPGALPNPVTREIPLRFEQLSLEDGLSQSGVYDIMQDRQGYMWFATQEGLNRYDGRSFNVYKSVPFDSTSLSGNWVTALAEDGDGNLWAGTRQNGLNRFDRRSETFSRFVHDPNDSTSLADDRIWNVLEDREGTIWIGTSSSLDRLDQETGTFTHFVHQTGDTSSLSSNVVYYLHEDPRGRIWVSTANGLNLLHSETGTFTRFLHTPGASPGENSPNPQHIILGITDDHTDPDVLWIGTGAGLLRFDARTGEYERHDVDPRDQGENIVIGSVADPQTPGVMWLATVGGGMARFDARTGKMDRYRHDPRDPGSIHHNSLWSIFADRSGTVWVGAQSIAGLSRFDPAGSGFVTYRHVAGKESSLRSGNVWVVYQSPSEPDVIWTIIANEGLRFADWLDRIDQRTGDVTHWLYEATGPDNPGNGRLYDILEDRRGTLWVASSQGGLHWFDRRSERFRAYRHDARERSSLAENDVHVLLEARDGRLWVGHHNAGVSRMDAPGVFTRFAPDPDKPGSLSGSNVTAIIEDATATVWIATRDGGLNRFDAATETFTRFRHHPNDDKSLASDHVALLHAGLGGELWVVTFRNGNVLQRLDPATGDITTFRHQPGGLSSSQIRSLYERPEEPGVLWVGTNNGGLNRVDGRTGEVKFYTESDGLTNNFVYGILGDDDGDLWLSTNNGLSRFDPDTETFRTYTVSDGLQSNEFNQGAYARGATGEMTFGGIKGLTVFDPTQLRENQIPPPVALTGFRLFNRPVPVGPESPLKQPLEETKEIRLSHWQNGLTFEFVGLHFQNPEKNQYAYQLEGFDTDWIEAGTQTFAAYTNLDPGKYTFRVRAANADGVWNEEGASLLLTILPPWWRTTWAYLLYGLLLAGAVLAVDRVQRRRLVKRERARAQERELEQARELGRAYARLEQSHAIVQAINAETGFESLLKAVLEQTRVIPGVQKATALVWDEAAGAYIFKASIGWDVSRIEPIRMTRQEAEARYVHDSDEVAEDVFIARDVARRPGNERIMELGLPAALLVMRVRTSEGVDGYIVFDNMDDPDAFAEQDVALLVGLKEHIRSAFVKTRLLESLRRSLDELKQTQSQLVYSEKLASLGALTAGIAHEIKNPLNFVNNFAQLTEELVEELREERERNPQALIAGFDDILDDLQLNAQKIAEHGRRADGIVRSMLEHSRGTKGEAQETDVNALVEEYVNLAFHGMRAQVPDFNVTIERSLAEDAGRIRLVPQEIGRVMLNLLNNAFHAVSDVKDSRPPVVSVGTRRENNFLEIHVQDNGPGIPEKLREKILEPFFTTKPAGQGTGLGLSLSYEIITQGHGGALTLESEEGAGTTFIIRLPVETERSR